MAEQNRNGVDAKVGGVQFTAGIINAADLEVMKSKFSFLSQPRNSLGRKLGNNTVNLVQITLQNKTLKCTKKFSITGTCNVLGNSWDCLGINASFKPTKKVLGFYNRHRGMRIVQILRANKGC